MPLLPVASPLHRPQHAAHRKALETLPPRVRFGQGADSVEISPAEEVQKLGSKQQALFEWMGERIKTVEQWSPIRSVNQAQKTQSANTVKFEAGKGDEKYTVDRQSDTGNFVTYTVTWERGTSAASPQPSNADTPVKRHPLWNVRREKPTQTERISWVVWGKAPSEPPFKRSEHATHQPVIHIKESTYSNFPLGRFTQPTIYNQTLALLRLLEEPVLQELERNESRKFPRLLSLKEATTKVQ